jgi:hypothetical protein
MVGLGEYIQVVIAVIYASTLVFTIFQFSSMKKSMFVQSVQQTYSTTMQDPTVSEYYSLVDNPHQYYIIILHYRTLICWNSFFGFTKQSRLMKNFGYVGKQLPNQ